MTKIFAIKLTVLAIFNRIIIELPYGGKVNVATTVSTKRMSVEDANIIDSHFVSFQRRIVAIMINTKVAIPDITTKTTGAVEFPSRSEADDKTDNIYATIPKIASDLFSIDLLFFKRYFQ